MNINIIAGKSSEANLKHIFGLIKNRDKSKKHIIIAPDRSLFSLEQRLFDETKESCFFDVSITSISKLSKGLLSKLNNKNILTKQSGVALVKKLLQINKDNLTTFKKSTSFIGFASTLFETICLYKSCNISPEDVYVDDSQNLYNLKQKDIKLIYTEYEKFLQSDFTDSFNQLMLFTKNIDREFCKDAIYYFVEFDDFTSIMYGIIAKLAAFSDATYISAPYGKENTNSNIYSNKVYFDLISLFKSQGLEFNINKVATDDLYNRELENNLLAYNPNNLNMSNDKIAINCFDSIYDEIKYTIARIYQSVMKDQNLTFSDFAIVLPNLNEYLPYMKRELDKYGISYFIDQNEIMIDHILTRTLLNICKMIAGDFSRYDFVSVLKSALLNFDINAVYDYDNFLHKIGAKGNQCFNTKLISDESIARFVERLLNARSSLKDMNTWQEYLDIVIEIFNYIQSRSEEYFGNLSSLEQRIFNQVLDKFESINNDFLSVFARTQSDFREFLETYQSYFETTNISLPPISSNSLFIADFNSSYISTYSLMYILGCNEGIMPKLQLDNGLVTDEEIARLPIADKINPTISMLNKRKIFKLFELVFKAKNSLNISYILADSKGKLYPNNLVQSLINIYDLKVENKSVELDQINNSAYRLNIDNIAFNNLTPQVSLYNILTLNKNIETYRSNGNFLQMYRTLIDSNNQEYIDKLLNNRNIGKSAITIGQVDLFKNKTTSVSQIESYYNCPYMHFVNYGLRLNKKEEYRLEANDIGTIIHQVLKIIMPRILVDDEDEVIIEANKTLDMILHSDEYIEMLNNPINAYIIKSLYNELARSCIAVQDEIKSSSFKPSIKHLEYRFNPDSLIINGIKIKGSIDRVDMNGDDFIIIDYKTGDNHFNNYSEVYSGKKLQLLVYARAFANETGKNLCGVYYFPLSNNFAKNDATYSYRFNGVTYNKRENILAIDNSLSEVSTKSKTLHLSTTKDGEFSKTNSYNYMCINKDDFDYLVDFAIKQVNIAITAIMIGMITPRPIKSGQFKVCNFCEYKGLCNYQDNNDHIQETITNIEELKTKEKKNGTRTE